MVKKVRWRVLVMLTFSSSRAQASVTLKAYGVTARRILPIAMLAWLSVMVASANAPAYPDQRVELLGDLGDLDECPDVSK